MNALTGKLMALTLLASLSTGCGTGSDLLLNAANMGNESLSTKNNKESSSTAMAKLTAAKTSVAYPCLSAPAVAATQPLSPDADFTAAATDDTPVASTAARAIVGQAISPCSVDISAAGEAVAMTPALAPHVTCGTFAYAVPALALNENFASATGAPTTRAMRTTPALVASPTTSATGMTYTQAAQAIPAHLSVRCGEEGVLVGMASATAADAEGFATTRPSSVAIHCGTTTAVASVPAQRLENSPTLSDASAPAEAMQPVVYTYTAVAGATYSTAPASGYNTMPAYPAIACGEGSTIAVESTPALPAE